MTADRAPRRNPRAGVALLEFLVSLVLMAAIALALASVLGLTGRALTRIGGQGAGADLLLARLTLRTWIETAPRSVGLYGTADGMAFTTLIDGPPFSAADLTTVSLARDAGGAVAAEAREPGQNGGTRRLILSPGGGLRIAYYGGLSPVEPPGWREDWPSGAGLPDLIRIDYDRAGRALPPLTVIPALEARQSEMSLSSPLPPG